MVLIPRRSTEVLRLPALRAHEGRWKKHLGQDTAARVSMTELAPPPLGTSRIVRTFSPCSLVSRAAEP